MAEDCACCGHAANDHGGPWWCGVVTARVGRRSAVVDCGCKGYRTKAQADVLLEARRMAETPAQFQGLKPFLRRLLEAFE